MPHETRAVISATENGRVWAILEVSPLTDSARSVFPLIPNGWGGGHYGDTNKKSESGVIISNYVKTDKRHALSIVVSRAATMHRNYSA